MSDDIIEELILEEPISEDDEILEEEEVVEEVIEEPPLTEEELLAIAEEEERLRLEAEALAERNRRLAFEQDLKDRYASLHDRNAACHQLGISNPDLYFDQLVLYNKEELDASKNMKAIEDMDAANKQAEDARAYLDGRIQEYNQIDKLLLEALAEKEEGREEKMIEYKAKRAAIKAKFPKP